MAISPNANIDFAKICDHIELIPQLRPETVLEKLFKQKQGLYRKKTIINTNKNIPLTRADSDPLKYFSNGIDNTDTWRLAIGNLLANPRMLKACMRRMDLGWESLAGEVYFDELLSITALRVAAPEALSFLINNRTKTPHHTLPQSAKDKIYEQIKINWQKATETISSKNEAAAALTCFVARDLSPALETAYILDIQPQSCNLPECGNEYFSILVSENTSKKVRDQEIIEIITKAPDSAPHINQLSELILEEKITTEAIKRFDDDKINYYKLLSSIHSLLQHKHKQDASYYTRATPSNLLHSMTKLGNSTMPDNWIISEAVSTLSTSAKLSHDIIYFWETKHCESNNINKDTWHKDRYPTIITALSKKIADLTHSELSSIFENQNPSLLKNLIFPFGNTPDYNQFKTCRNCGLNGSIISAAKKAQNAILPQVIEVLCDPELPDKSPEQPFSVNHAKALFGDEKEICNLIANWSTNNEHNSAKHKATIAYCKKRTSCTIHA